MTTVDVSRQVELTALLRSLAAETGKEMARAEHHRGKAPPRWAGTSWHSR